VVTAVDVCPLVGDTSQTDGDDDGRGDACDTCPGISNGGPKVCPVSIETLRDPNAANHPKYGAVVSLPAAYVTAVSTTGFPIQDYTLAPYSGVFIAGTTTAKRGNQVAVTGVFTNPGGLAQVVPTSITITDAATVLPFGAIAVASSDIKTGGPLADSYQSMLVVLTSPSITNDSPDGSGQFFEFVVDSACRVDDLLWAQYGQPKLPYPPAGFTNGTQFKSLFGVVGYSFSNSKLWPRDAADIQR
jgi:hypothetical protein